MLKRLRIVFALVTFTILVYVKITEDFAAMSYVMLFLGSLMLLIGIEYLKKETAPYLGYFFIIAALFNYYVCVESYLMG